MANEGQEDLLPVEIAKGIGGAITDTSKNIYHDLLQRPARALGTIVGAPLERLAQGVEKHLGPKPPEDISPPPLQIAGPSIIGFVICQEVEELQSMYTRLLATSMTELDKTHPSFARVIQELSPVEAHLLKALRDSEYGQKIVVEQSAVGALPKRTIGAGSTITAQRDGQTFELVGALEDNLTRLGLMHTTPQGDYDQDDAERHRLQLDLTMQVIGQARDAGYFAPERFKGAPLTDEQLLADPYCLHRLGCQPRISFQQLTAYGCAFVDACIPRNWSW